MTIPVIDQVDEAASGKEALIDELFDGVRPYFTLGIHRSTCVGLTFGVYGGRFASADLAGQTITLAASATNYVEANDTTGVLSSNTSAYSGAGFIALGIAVTTGSGLSTWSPEDRIGLGGPGGGVSLSTVNVWTKNQSVARYTLTDGATVAVDASQSNTFRLVIGGNRTLGNPSNPTDGMQISILVKQDGTGSRTLGYASKYKFPGGIPPSLSTAANAYDLLAFEYDATGDIWLGTSLQAFS